MREPQQTWSGLPWPEQKETFIVPCETPKGYYAPKGAGMSYGDCSVSQEGCVALANDDFFFFDENRKLVKVGGGARLADIIRRAWRSGMTLPVVPGTSLVSVGGAIASDVHGKNHHVAGSFGAHVEELSLWRSDAGLLTLRPGDELFDASCGGMGLTGVIVSATLRLEAIRSPRMVVSDETFSSIDEFFDKNGGCDAPYAVAWLDCRQGSGILSKGRRAEKEDDSRLTEAAPLGRFISWPPIPMPNLVTPTSTRLFNLLYAARPGINGKEHLAHEGKWLFPLDSVANWNRIYGKRGFYQHQARFPSETAPEAIKESLSVLKSESQGSFLAVLKTLGEKKTRAMATFAKAGVTLAVDLPNWGASTEKTLRSLASIARESGGGVYACKDAVASPEDFEAGCPEWRDLWRLRDPMASSAQSRRTIEELARKAYEKEKK